MPPPPPRRPLPRPAAGLAPTRLDPSAARPLHRQVADALRQDVLAGKLRPGRRLTSSRALADQLGVSRNTVLQAFDQLTAEGYLVGVRGSGTFVSGDLPAAPADPSGSPAPPTGLGARELPISRAGRDLIALADGQRSTLLRPFQSGIAALDALPLALYRRVAARAFADLELDDLGYGDPRGFAPLRRALADLLWSSRGVSCEPDQIFVVGGSQHALDLAARVLLDPGDRAWIEDPGYLGTRAALASSGAELVPIPLDGDGLIVEHGRQQAPDARLACVTPSHQYPLGTVMGVGRRLELLEWARGAGAWILEDDYDSEFRYAGRPLPALKSLDGSERVLYVGTFSKVLFPALRLGYLVVPRPLVGAFLGARFCSGRQAPIADQAAIHRFLREGHLARHLRRMRGLYRERQRCLLEAVAETLTGRLEVAPSEVGMHLVGWLPDGIDDREVAERAALRGLRAEPLSRYVLQHTLRPGLLLGYTAFDRASIRQGVAELGVAIDG
jgi:GntR family transcriptional regulator / MocR family aminotransferase